MAPGQPQPKLIELPEDVLLRVAGYLPFWMRLELSLVCRRLSQLCAGPSELWRVVDAHIRFQGEGTPARDMKTINSFSFAMASFRRRAGRQGVHA